MIRLLPAERAIENYPDAGDSDVDFMVRPQDAGTIAGLLREVARRTDALLVQAIQHETTAWYFVLAKQVGGAVAYLHPGLLDRLPAGRAAMAAVEGCWQDGEAGKHFRAGDRGRISVLPGQESAEAANRESQLRGSERCTCAVRRNVASGCGGSGLRSKRRAP